MSRRCQTVLFSIPLFLLGLGFVEIIVRVMSLFERKPPFPLFLLMLFGAYAIFGMVVWGWLRFWSVKFSDNDE